MKEQIESTKAQLRDMLPPDVHLYTILRHVSPSGTTRRISLAVANAGKIVLLDRYAAELLKLRLAEKGGLICRGHGMDMGHWLANQFMHAVYDGAEQGVPRFNHHWLQ